MPDSMNEIKVEYETKFGKIIVKGRREAAKPKYEYEVPEEIEVVE